MSMQPIFAITIGKLTIDYCRNYGIDRRSGWSLQWDGSYLFQLKKTRTLPAMIENLPQSAQSALAAVALIIAFAIYLLIRGAWR